MRSLVLPLSIQYLPSSHRPAFLFCPASLAHGTGTLYCTFTLKEKDTQFPLTRLQDSTIKPVATILPSLSVLFSWIKGGVLSSCYLADTPSSPLPVNPLLLFPSSSWVWGWVPRWYLGTVAQVVQVGRLSSSWAVVRSCSRSMAAGTVWLCTCSATVSLSFQG